MDIRRRTRLTAAGYFSIGLLINTSSIGELVGTPAPVSRTVSIVLSLAAVLGIIYLISAIEPGRSLLTPAVYLVPTLFIYPSALLVLRRTAISGAALLMVALAAHVFIVGTLYTYNAAINASRVRLDELDRAMDD
ncbi:hypothetical protein BRC89_01485 [Halobacteriales archaeon QS_4_70_19]|nr:MAG: hypothetical protein BRC89_01485 [Halobacteriales archaeon QS_4_70_19]